VVKGDADGVDGGHLHLIVAGDLLAVHVNVPAHLPQAFDVLLFRPHDFLLLLSCFKLGLSGAIEVNRENELPPPEFSP
jgi:hypothetical protein